MSGLEQDATKVDSFRDRLPTKAQGLVLSRVSGLCRAMGRPPSELTAAGAFIELRGQHLPYVPDDGVGPVPYEPGQVSLPDQVGPMASPKDCLCAAHSELLEGGRSCLLQSPEEIRPAIELCGVSKPYVDPAFNSPKLYSAF